MSDEKFDRMIRLLEEILKWEKIGGIQQVKNVLAELLKTDVEKLVYENSDNRTSREISEITGVSHATVINYWKKWAKYGIVEEVRAQGGTRYKRIFSLSDFGIEVPEVKVASIMKAEDKEQDSSKEIGKEED